MPPWACWEVFTKSSRWDLFLVIALGGANGRSALECTQGRGASGGSVESKPFSALYGRPGSGPHKESVQGVQER